MKSKPLVEEPPIASGNNTIQNADTVGNNDPKANKNKLIGPNSWKINKEIKTSSYGRFLWTLVYIFILFEYCSYISICEYNRLARISTLTNAVVRLLFFHILMILWISALIWVSRTNAGMIPLYWGFYIGDQDFKKKRYCLICQVFKPDRTHHCSICNICVLNMDHHCPWVNNCIGYYNRKYFLQLLLYFICTLYYLDILYVSPSYQVLTQLYKTRHTYNFLLVIKSMFYIGNHTVWIVLSIWVTRFFLFHLRWMLGNLTTIETWDPANEKFNKYFLGYRDSIEQVFGTNVLLWFIPWVAETGFPKGDGLIWEIKTKPCINNDKKDIISINGKSEISESTLATMLKQNQLQTWGHQGGDTKSNISSNFESNNYFSYNVGAISSNRNYLSNDSLPRNATSEQKGVEMKSLESEKKN